jgi:hypothetical protein
LSELISQREYARRRGISHVAVQHAVKSGRISTVGGRIDPDLADREWLENTDQSKPRNRITGRPKDTRDPGEPSRPMDLDGSGRTGVAAGYARARAVRESCMAQLAGLELERRLNELVRADEVKVARFKMNELTKKRLREIPGNVSAAIAATRDVDEVRRILQEEFERVCRELSGEEEP